MHQVERQAFAALAMGPDGPHWWKHQHLLYQSRYLCPQHAASARVRENRAWRRKPALLHMCGHVNTIDPHRETGCHGSTPLLRHRGDRLWKCTGRYGGRFHHHGHPTPPYLSRAIRKTEVEPEQTRGHNNSLFLNQLLTSTNSRAKVTPVMTKIT